MAKSPAQSNKTKKPPAPLTVNVNILDFGGNGDGITDNYSAFTAAENYVNGHGGGEIYVPAGTYLVQKAFNHLSFVTLRGDGITSIIKNPITTPSSDDKQWCIHIGNFSPSDFGDCTHYDVNNVTAGDTKVILTNTAEAALFRVGQVVLIDTEDGFISTDGQLKPYESFINRIASINIDSGIVRLEDTISANINNAKIAPAKTSNCKEYICQNPTIRDIRFESFGDWTLRWGCYKGLFENISIKSTDVLAGNGLSHCTFRNITATFSQKVIEMAMYSHDTVVDTLTATWETGYLDPDKKPLIKMGENVRDCQYSNMLIDATGSASIFNSVISIGHAFDNEIFDNHFIAPTVLGSGVDFSTADPLSIVTGNNVHDNIFDLGGGDYYILFDNETSGSNMSFNTVINNTFSGGRARQDVKINGTPVNNTYVPNTYLP